MSAERRYVDHEGKVWVASPRLQHPGHLAPGQASLVDVVYLEGDKNYVAALRRFPNGRDLQLANKALATNAQALPRLLATVDDAEGLPALVTTWSPGSGDVGVLQQRRADDVASLLGIGSLFSPLDTLELLIALGSALDSLAECNLYPVELSPDHLVFDGASIALVGLSRLGYQPGVSRLPDPGTMSEGSVQLVGSDIPTGAASGQWVQAQIRALMRLATWMAAGAPTSLGRMSCDADRLVADLVAAGFQSTDVLRHVVDRACRPDAPGGGVSAITKTLADLAGAERHAAAESKIRRVKHCVVYDHASIYSVSRELWDRNQEGKPLEARVTASERNRMTFELSGNPGDRQVTGTVGLHGVPEKYLSDEYVDLPRQYPVGKMISVSYRFEPGQRGHPIKNWRVVREKGMYGPRRGFPPTNPEPARLQLIRECSSSDAVLPIAGVPRHYRTGNLVTLLASSGWLIVEPEHLPAAVDRVKQLNPSVNIQFVNPPSACPDNTPVAGVDPLSPNNKPSPQLSYLDDVDLKGPYRDLGIYRDGIGQSFLRRNFALAWSQAAKATSVGDGQRPAHRTTLDYRRRGGLTLADLFEDIKELFPDDPALGMLVCDELLKRKKITREHYQILKDSSQLLLALPAGGLLRRDVLRTLLSSTSDAPLSVLAGELLPFIRPTAETYDPRTELWPGSEAGLLLQTSEGIRRMGLHARLTSAGAPELANEVGEINEGLLSTLLTMPLESLIPVLVRITGSDLDAERLAEVVGRDVDIDLLTRFTPSAWERLLGDLEADGHIHGLGVGWYLAIERSQRAESPFEVDGRRLLEIANGAGRPPPELVRALLAVPTETWPGIFDSTDLAVLWFRHFQNLHVGTLLDRFGARSRDVVALLGISEVVRLLAAPQFDIATFDFAAALADTVGSDPRRLLRSIVANAAIVDVIDPKDQVIGHWWKAMSAGGYDEVQLVTTLVAEPDVARNWAVNGEQLVERIVADLTNTGIPTDRIEGGTGTRDLLELLGSHPQAGPQLRQIAQDLPAEVRSAIDLLQRHACAGVAAQLARIMTTSKPDYVASLVSRGFDIERACNLESTDEALIGALGDVARFGDLNLVGRLHAYGISHGVEAMVQAVVACGLPDGRSVDVLTAWGPAVAGWILDCDGPWREWLISVLAPLKPQNGSASWLLQAGADGVKVLGEFGQPLLDAVETCDLDGEDIQLFARVWVMTEGRPSDLWHFVSGEGVPFELWPSVQQLMNRGRSPGQIRRWLRSHEALEFYRTILSATSTPGVSG